MARNGTWLLAVLATATAAGADESLVARWDKPRVETFDMKDALPQEVLREIRTRYGVAIGDLALDLPRIDFEAKDVTFFEALDRLAARHRLLVAEETGEPLALVRPARPMPPMPVAHVGPSRFSVEAISVLSTARWMAEEPRRFAIEDELLRTFRGWTDTKLPFVRLEIRWRTEPGLEEVSLVGFAVRRAVDDTGAELALRRAPDLPVAANGSFWVEIEKPSAKARSIAKLEGRLRVALPHQEGEVAFTADEIRKRKPLGNAMVKLEDIEDAVVRLSIEGAPCEALKPCADHSHPNEHGIRVGSRADRSRLAVTVLGYDAEGTEIAGSLKRAWSDVNFESVTYWIRLDAAPARIVLRSTTAALVREAPFSFTDIPLPE